MKHRQHKLPHRFDTEGQFFTAVCALEVVAPPINKGMLKPLRCISLATNTISSKDGVIRPDNPMMSHFHQSQFARFSRKGPLRQGQQCHSHYSQVLRLQYFYQYRVRHL